MPPDMVMIIFLPFSHRGEVKESIVEVRQQ